MFRDDGFISVRGSDGVAKNRSRSATTAAGAIHPLLIDLSHAAKKREPALLNTGRRTAQRDVSALLHALADLTVTVPEFERLTRSALYHFLTNAGSVLLRIPQAASAGGNLTDGMRLARAAAMPLPDRLRPAAARTDPEAFGKRVVERLGEFLAAHGEALRRGELEPLPLAPAVGTCNSGSAGTCASEGSAPAGP